VMRNAEIRVRLRHIRTRFIPAITIGAFPVGADQHGNLRDARMALSDLKRLISELEEESDGE